MAQNWSNLFYYINSKLASNVNALELTNADLQSIILNVTLPDFSIYMPLKKVYKLTMGMLVPGSLNKYTFKLPVATEGFTIVRVEEAYYSRLSNNTSLSNVNNGVLINPEDIAMAQQSIDMRASLSTVRTYDFIPPDIITFNKIISADMLLDLSIEHTSPDTIPSDLYHKLFKKIALRDVLDNIIMARSKYTNLATPLGQIELNIDNLVQIRDRLNDEIKETEDNVPPDVMVTFL